MDETSLTQTTPQPWRRKAVLGALIAFAFFGGLALHAYNARTEPGAAPQTVTTPEPVPVPAAESALPRGNPAPLPSPPARVNPNAITLTSEEYEAEEHYYLTLSGLQNPRAALETLRAHVEHDSALLRSCHAITHSIGQDAYARYQNFTVAMQYLDDICNTGYMHGVIEARFKRSENIENDVLTVCDAHSEGRCFHGVGHGLMFYTENKLPLSLDYCEKLPKLSSRQYCAEGVFMENFNTDQKTHPSAYLSNTDFLFPCAEQKSRYQNACHYYAPIHFLKEHPNGYTEALAWCNTAPENGVLPCVRGVAAVAIKEHITEPKLVEAACMTAPQPKQIPYCIDGLTGLYINHYNSLDKAYTMCRTLEPQNQKACTAGVKSREATFEAAVQ